MAGIALSPTGALLSLGQQFLGGVLGGLLDDAPKYGTQIVRLYEHGYTPEQAAQLMAAVGPGKDPRKLEALRRRFATRKVRSIASDRDCVYFNVWQYLAYGIARIPRPDEGLSRCYRKGAKRWVDREYGNGAGDALSVALIDLYERLRRRP